MTAEPNPMDPTEDDLIGQNAFKVAITADNFVGVGIYNVVDDPELGGIVAKFAAGIKLTPQKAYEIAQEFTKCAMKVEENADPNRRDW